MCFFSMENFARPSSSDTKDNQNTYIINLIYVKSELCLNQFYEFLF